MEGSKTETCKKCKTITIWIKSSYNTTSEFYENLLLSFPTDIKDIFIELPLSITVSVVQQQKLSL